MTKTCLVLFAAAASVVDAHMSLVLPPSRNAVDRALPPWQGGKWWPYEPNCSNPDPHWNPQIPSGCIPNGTDGWGCNCANGTDACDVAQSCFWFSQGCTIGCKTCDGGPSNPNTKDRCGSGMVATVNDPLLRTYERDVVALSPQDQFRYNPWRAPGFAPVFDSCGMAGGGPHQQGGEAKYTPTQFAQQGDLGTGLPAAPTGIVWNRGEKAIAKWSIRANHGGGYQYRLCPANETLNEECFMKTPLPFASSLIILEFDDGTNQTIQGTTVSYGTNPEGSTWRMNPLPYSNSETPPQFDPPCNETEDRTKTDTGRCSGRDPFNTLIVDELVIPSTLAPGDYVVSLRWDCEKSAQIWTNCADLTVV